jgi:hypothetical protein
MDKFSENSIIVRALEKVATKYIESIESSPLDSLEKERQITTVKELLQKRLDLINKET